MSSYVTRRLEADRYLNEQIKICAKVFQCKPSDFRLPTLEEDFNGVDLWIGNKGIALRVRNRKLDDFTLRLFNNSNGENELTKLKGGNMDYILQCQADKIHDGKISDWFLFNGSKLKDVATDNFRDIKTHHLSGDNYDFLAINIDDLFDKVQGSIIAKGFTREIEIENENGTVERKYIRQCDWYEPKEEHCYQSAES